MPKVCGICGKGGRVGSRIIRHGLAKSKGGIGLHTTGITKRKFAPNLQRVRVVDGGSVVRKTVCTTCIKSNRIKKA
jgi:large subunit ribosomal protein L28